jgi:hypothetical protein
MFDDDANNTFIVYIYMRVCLECRIECKIDTRKEWWKIQTVYVGACADA